jgi:hypothetical protein
MSDDRYLLGLRKAHSILLTMHEELLAEHDRLKPNWLGLPPRRSNEIVSECHALVEASRRVFEEANSLRF